MALQIRAVTGKGLTKDQRAEARRLSGNLLKLNALEDRQKAAKAAAH
jgi:hypothetical protein